MINLFKWRGRCPAGTSCSLPTGRRRLLSTASFLAGKKRRPIPARRARISRSPPAGRPSAACSPKPAMEPVPFWLYYFYVGDIDVAIKRVKAGGGQILDGPIEVPGKRWIVPMHGSSGRHLRAGRKAQPQRHRIFRARRVTQSARRLTPPQRISICTSVPVFHPSSCSVSLHSAMKLMLNPQKQRIGERCKCKQHHGNRNHLLGLHQLHGVDDQRA